MLSVIVPSFKDPLLCKTVASLLGNSVLDIEVIPVLDGYSTDDIPNDPRVKTVHLDVNKGMRGATNAGLSVAKGKFVMKTDSHCLYAPGYDKTMTESCAENWLMIPSRYSLDDINWKRDESRPVRDYHFLSFPAGGHYGYDMAVLDCKKHTRRHMDIPIDDTMIFQGSCWLANRKYFMEHVGMMDDRPETYGTFACEPAEVGLKYWLGGGEVKVNKNTWYAHLRKAKRHYDAGIYGVNYKRGRGAVAGHTWTTKHWMGDEEPNMIHPFSWLIEKFWPIPTWEVGWEEKWREECP